MSTRYDPNMGFQEPGFISGSGKCNPINEKEYYNTQYTPMFDGKGGASKNLTKKKASTTKKSAKKPTKKSSSKKHTRKRGGTDSFDEFSKLNITFPYATHTGGTELASEYYTSAQQGSYAPYNSSKDEKIGGGRKKKMSGGGEMDEYQGRMSGSMGQASATTAVAETVTKGGGCGCGYNPKSTKETNAMMGGKKAKSKPKKTKPKAKRGGSGNDGYYANTLTGDDTVNESSEELDGQLNGGAKKKKTSKTKSKTLKKTKSKTLKKTKSKTLSKRHTGGDDSAGVGSDFATTLASRGPCNYPDGKSADLFRIFNKTSEFIPNSQLKYAAAPISTGVSPDPNPYPRAYNDDFIGGTKKAKAKKSSSSKTKAKKPAKKSASSKTKAKAKPAKKSSSSKTKSKAKKH